MKKTLIYLGIILLALGAAIAVFLYTAKIDVERTMGVNSVIPHAPFTISPEASELHNSMLIADWHTDSLMWLRNLLERSDIGQVDFPRLKEGNVAVQVFTSVTRVPSAGIQLENNPAEGDKIALLAFMDKWPAAARKSLLHRSLYHSNKLFELEKQEPETVRVILDQAGLGELLAARQKGQPVTGAILGTEGLHSLEGDIANIERLYDAGYRVMGLFHFFDNELGGSLHGTSGGGLSPFGRQVVSELMARDIVVDVAHASEASVIDVLELVDGPVILSHTGMRGVCDSKRNIPDALMQKIAAKGGLIGIGYFEIAICEMTPESVVKHLRYAIDLLGVEHVSLGSDYDGSVETPFDVSEVAILTELMLQQGFSEQEIRAIMGENTLRFLTDNLPRQ